MAKVVGRNATTGQLQEFYIPELLVVRRQGGSWNTIKASDNFMTLAAPTRVVTFNVAGWYRKNRANPEFRAAGSTDNAGFGFTYYYGPMD